MIRLLIWIMIFIGGFVCGYRIFMDYSSEKAFQDGPAQVQHYDGKEVKK